MLSPSACVHACSTNSVLGLRRTPPRRNKWSSVATELWTRHNQSVADQPHSSMAATNREEAAWKVSGPEAARRGPCQRPKCAVLLCIFSRPLLSRVFCSDTKHTWTSVVLCHETKNVVGVLCHVFVHPHRLESRAIAGSGSQRPLPPPTNTTDAGNWYVLSPKAQTTTLIKIDTCIL